jgi:hypothetical protein
MMHVTKKKFTIPLGTMSFEKAKQVISKFKKSINMDKPVFNNTENLPHLVSYPDGKEKTVWVSRSVALHGILILRVDDIDYLLVTKRSDKCPDEVGKYANVTGYLDWDESGINGLKREYWEEVGLYFDKYLSKDNLIYGDLDQPFSVKTEPTANRQNVTLRYGFAFKCERLPRLNFGEEVSEAYWSPVADVLTMIDKDPKQYAWDHSEIISKFLDDFYSENQFIN